MPLITGDAADETESLLHFLNLGMSRCLFQIQFINQQLRQLPRGGSACTLEN